MLNRSTARVRLVHLLGAKKADHFLICGSGPSYRVGDRVEVRMPDGQWLPGFVDERTDLEPGGVVPVTLRTG